VVEAKDAKRFSSGAKDAGVFREQRKKGETDQKASEEGEIRDRSPCWNILMVVMI
jgi:hypothetical protein